MYKPSTHVLSWLSIISSSLPMFFSCDSRILTHLFYLILLISPNPLTWFLYPNLFLSQDPLILTNSFHVFPLSLPIAFAWCPFPYRIIPFIWSHDALSLTDFLPYKSNLFELTHYLTTTKSALINDQMSVGFLSPLNDDKE